MYTVLIIGVVGLVVYTIVTSLVKRVENRVVGLKVVDGRVVIQVFVASMENPEEPELLRSRWTTSEDKLKDTRDKLKDLYSEKEILQIHESICEVYEGIESGEIE